MAEQELEIHASYRIQETKRKYVTVNRKEASKSKSVDRIEKKYANILKQLDTSIDSIQKCRLQCVEDITTEIQMDMSKKLQNWWNLTVEERANRIVQTQQCVNEHSSSKKCYSSGYPLQIPLCLSCFRSYNGISRTMWIERGKQLASGQINFKHTILTALDKNPNVPWTFPK